MRVLQLVDHMGRGGAQDLIRTLVEGLGRVAPAGDGLEFTVASIFAAGTQLRLPEGVGSLVLTDLPYRASSAIGLRAVRATQVLFEEQTYDIVHAHLYVSAVYLGLLHRWQPSLFRGSSLVYTMHANRRHLSSPFFYLTMGSLAPFRVIVTEFEESRDEVRGLWAARRARHEYIPLGVDSGRFHARGRTGNRDYWRRRLGLEERDLVLVSVARLHTQRRIETFLRALPSVHRGVLGARGRRAVLVLVGDGEKRHDYERLAQRLGIQEQVVFLGSEEDSPEMYWGADAYFTIAVGRDLGLAAWKAGLCGCPIVAANVGIPVATGVHDEGHFLLVEGVAAFASAAISVLEDPELGERLARRAVHTGERRHTSAAMVGEYARIYRSFAEARA